MLRTIAALAALATLMLAAPPTAAAPTLALVQTVTRHGDRTPIKAIAASPATWTCHASTTLAPLSTPVDELAPPLARVFNKRYIDGRQALAGNCSAGQLTTIGQAEQRALGAALRTAYVDTGFLPPVLDIQSVYVRASDVPRCVMSAEELINALYPPPPAAAATAVVPVWAIDKALDPMTINVDLCPELAVGVAEVLARNTSLAAQIAADLAPWMGVLEKALATKDPLAVLGDYDNINCRVHHGLPLPGSPPMPREAYDALYDAWNTVGTALFSGSAFALGPFYATLLDNMHAVADGRGGPVKFRLFSGHDTSVGPLLVALGAWNNTWPPYAAHVTLELYVDAAAPSPDTATVRTLYQGLPLTLPACGTPMCPLATFTAQLSRFIPADYHKACKVDITPSPHTAPPVHSSRSTHSTRAPPPPPPTPVSPLAAAVLALLP